jgi:hypothetical protein
MKSLSKLKHYAQSNYALDYLKSNGINGQLLSDPIPIYTSHNYLQSLQEKCSKATRSNTILYNPHKGKKVIDLLISYFPNWHFFPLSGFNREELANKFLGSKLYIDFGHHPGKDRLPREAAIHGCCVITGLHGSASNYLDVNIPSSYKIDPQVKSFLDTFKEKVSLIFNDFEKCSAEFSEYRETISQEQVEFEKQINQIFSIPSK